MEPRILNKGKAKIFTKTCTKCGRERPTEVFIRSNAWFYADGYLPICNDCIAETLAATGWNWEQVDRFCQMIDIPFIPREFEKMHEANGNQVMPVYAKYFGSSTYENLGWEEYYKKYTELKQKNQLDLELPNISDSYYEDLMIRWGSNYDSEQLVYLENLYNGLLATQNVNGALQMDQAQKLCKISLQIDERIRGDQDFDKLMATYEKMTKVADFTPKNSKSDADFSSFGEVQAWLEKRGWINKFYDDANRDIVDEVIHSNQAFVQRLYTNESGIGEEISERIQQLKIAAELEKQGEDLERKRFEEDGFFDMEEVDLDRRDNKVYEDLIVDDDDDDNLTKGV